MTLHTINALKINRTNSSQGNSWNKLGTLPRYYNSIVQKSKSKPLCANDGNYLKGLDQPSGFRSEYSIIPVFTVFLLISIVTFASILIVSLATWDSAYAQPSPNSVFSYDLYEEAFEVASFIHPGEIISDKESIAGNLKILVLGETEYSAMKPAGFALPQSVSLADRNIILGVILVIFTSMLIVLIAMWHKVGNISRVQGIKMANRDYNRLP